MNFAEISRRLNRNFEIQCSNWIRADDNVSRSLSTCLFSIDSCPILTPIVYAARGRSAERQLYSQPTTIKAFEECVDKKLLETIDK